MSIEQRTCCDDVPVSSLMATLFSVILTTTTEKEDGALHIPNPTIPFEKGDNLWIVGEKKDVESMMTL